MAIHRKAIRRSVGTVAILIDWQYFDNYLLTNNELRVIILPVNWREPIPQQERR